MHSIRLCGPSETGKPPHVGATPLMKFASAAASLPPARGCQQQAPAGTISQLLCEVCESRRVLKSCHASRRWLQALVKRSWPTLRGRLHFLRCHVAQVLGEVPLMSLGILGTVGAVSVELILRLLKDLRPRFFGPLEVLVHVVNVDE